MCYKIVITLKPKVLETPYYIFFLKYLSLYDFYICTCTVLHHILHQQRLVCTLLGKLLNYLTSVFYTSHISSPDMVYIAIVCLVLRNPGCLVYNSNRY